ncbi:DUF4286 family protein [Lysobacter sp. Root983]|uniref:DUF4286 family protein n=1 Tax=Lysobacter sp. Root983 TaxID=1736613 RepID=UPI00070919DA|nr:DUF4286 family protein [Lysobacter sp. Root983]KRD77009.1 hypothetical protein ASE43_07435 [Lysobacter sp. Root983]
MSAGVVYEVNLDLDAAIADDYRAWLGPHTREILALPGFLDARIHTQLDPPAEPGRVRLSVRYRLDRQESLDAYVRDHAPRMRADAVARFGDRFSATRRVLSED